MKKSLRFPPQLQPKAIIGLVAPSSPVSSEEKDICKKYLLEKGFSVVVGDALEKNEKIYGYLAGDAKQRATDLNKMFSDSQIDAIFCIRGGYGSSEILPYLDYQMISENPKIFLGYSDITALHMALQKYCGFVTFHGPMVHTEFCKLEKRRQGNWAENTFHGPMVHTEFCKPEKQRQRKWAEEIYCGSVVHTELDKSRKQKQENCPEETYMWNSFYKACNQENSYDFVNPYQESFYVFFQGAAQGILTGGNLSVLVRLLGTPYQLDFQDKILFLEDVGEPVSKIHMNLIQLEQAGIFGKIKGLLLGDFTHCENEKYDSTIQVQDIFEKYVKKYHIPCMGNVCSDHRGILGTLPMGADCKLDTHKKQIQIVKYKVIEK